MREIKFRAWDKVRREYLSGGNIFISIERGKCPEKSYTYLDILKDADMCRDRFIIEQYTGLKDKNGVEIYEGDVLSEEGHLFHVIWDSKWAKFKLQHGRVYQYPEWNRGVLMELIGNEHDNPELMEVQNDL